jgi:hypothetical protein
VNTRVQLIGPTGSLLGTTYTDLDGFYMITYKHKGKAADFTVRLPDLNRQTVVRLKANGYAVVVFEDLP